MAGADFITALGRLLSAGKLRDAFSTDPMALAETMGLAGQDRAAFLQLVPEDLEFQATVLLRKRFDLVRVALPNSCSKMGPAAWIEFRVYGRSRGASTGSQQAEDVSGFCIHLAAVCPDALCPIELNRVRFAQGQRRCAFHFVKDMPVRDRHRAGVQIFLRRPRRGWHEWKIYLAA